MPTVREIAHHAGVSKTTVSLVLNNKDGVSEELRTRVLEAVRDLEAIDALQRRPSVGDLDAENGSSGPRSVVLLHPWWISNTQFFRELLQGIQAAADRFQVQLRLASMRGGDDPASLSQHVYFSDPTLRPDAVLVLESQFAAASIHKLESLGISSVMLGSPTDDPGIKTITPDEYAAGWMAAQALLDLGHRQIGFVIDNLEFRYARDRHAGYVAALIAAGLEAPSTQRLTAVTGFGSPLDPAFVANNQEITALIIANSAALDALDVFEQHGYRVPDTLSVIVFDDIEAARTYDPPLTTVAYPLYEQGYWGMRMIVDQIGEPAMEHFSISFKARLVERQSCQPPHAK